MNRRGFFGFFASCLAVVGLGKVAIAEPYNSRSYVTIMGSPPVKSFDELKAWISSLPIRQVDGPAQAWCDPAAKPYRAIHLGGLSRVGDESIIEADVAQAVQRHIGMAIDELRAEKLDELTLYWRTPLELEIMDHDRYDPKTKQFVPIPGWCRVTAYARLTIAKEAV